MIRIVRVLAPNPGPFTLEGTNTWVLGRGPSVVIDPGPDDPEHLRAVLREATPVGLVLLTHKHPDHAPGAARLARMSGAKVAAVRPDAGERPLRNGREIRLGDAILRVIHTPGHTADHACFFLEEEGALFTGDTVLGRGTSIVDPPDGDMSAYVHSLQALQRLGARVIYPGHGPVLFDAKTRLNEYVAHRARREQQVLAALGAGKETAGEMVPGIYETDVPKAMFPAAARSVLAHLLKLEKEGKAARTGLPGEGRFVPVAARACERCGRQAAPGSKYCRRCAMAVLQEGP